VFFNRYAAVMPGTIDLIMGYSLRVQLAAPDATNVFSRRFGLLRNGIQAPWLKFR